MKGKCVDIIEFMGCKNWRDEDCPYYNEKTKECEDQSRLKAAEEILNCLADSVSG